MLTFPLNLDWKSETLGPCICVPSPIRLTFVSTSLYPETGKVRDP